MPAKKSTAPAATPATKKKESARDKFKRLGGARVTKTLNAIRLLANLSGPGYEYTDEDLAKMFDVLGGALKNVESRMRNRGKAEKSEFQF